MQTDLSPTVTLYPGDSVIHPNGAVFVVSGTEEWPDFVMPVGGQIVSTIDETQGEFGDVEVGICYSFRVIDHVRLGHWLVRDIRFGPCRSNDDDDSAETYTGSCEHLTACTDPTDPGSSIDTSSDAASLGLDPWSRPITSAEEYLYNHLEMSETPALECAEYLRGLVLVGDA